MAFAFACAVCDGDEFPFILLALATLVAVAALVLLVRRSLRRQPEAMKGWVSTAVILYNHAQTLTIVGGTFWEAYTENEAKKKQAHAAMDAHAERDKAKAKGDEFSGIRYQAMELEPMKKVMRHHDMYIEYILKPAEERYFDNGKSILGELDKCMAALEKEPESAAKEVMERVMGCQTRLLLLSGVVHALKIDGQVLHG